ncbi:efflux transporter, RND family, MFP subunit [Novosphingobium sp. Rr 2-17]|uniref:efflux RND transporter periplasmic adaptor subunit n=1 Tax=Novosphingobium sp. Rr 2-17 TaxID=555793 RepID=UPI000269A540|nr:efflux RND transporter periplasmic adaptor subunit [Novosphingobium sp. Rr 2-17]EIZ78523.1 efflux transporter, RND family, MFP subunit [Novosphingobium sp. Rr 2-17]
MLKNRRFLIVGAVVLVLVLAFLTWKLFLAAPEQPDVATTKVQRGTFEKTVEATGTLEPGQLVGVGSQASGRIEKLNVAIGDTVKAGDLIAEVDARTATNSLRTAQADLANVQAQLASSAATLAQKKLAYARQQALGAGEATSQADFESARADFQAAQASYDALKAQILASQVAVNTAEVNLRFTRITAPMDGVVVAIVTKQGQTVNAVQSAPTIVVLAKLDQMTIKAEVSEADVINVKQGQPAYFTILGDPDKKYESTLRLVEPAPESIVDEVNSSTQTSSSSSSTSSSAIYYNALFDVPNADGRLRALMTAKVTIVLARHPNALFIPSTALGAKNPDGTYPVRVKTEDGQIESRKVRTGLDNNVNVEVLSGLKEGEQVVVGEAKAGAGGRPGGGPPGGMF